MYKQCRNRSVEHSIPQYVHTLIHDALPHLTHESVFAAAFAAPHKPSVAQFVDVTVLEHAKPPWRRTVFLPILPLISRDLLVAHYATVVRQLQGNWHVVTGKVGARKLGATGNTAQRRTRNWQGQLANRRSNCQVANWQVSHWQRCNWQGRSQKARSQKGSR